MSDFIEKLQAQHLSINQGYFDNIILCKKKETVKKGANYVLPLLIRLFSGRVDTGCTTWTLIKRMEKKLDGNCTRMLQAILNKLWRQHPTKRLLYDYLPLITKTIKVRRTIHAGHCWRSRDELISDVLLWIHVHGRVKAGRPARTYIKQLCEESGYCCEDLPEAMNNREEWRERVRDIRASGMTWWWGWWFFWYSTVEGKRS